MALIVQNPEAPTEEANSYQSLEDARQRALYLGVTLPVADEEAERKILIGMQYVDAKKYQGFDVIPFQGTKFPRCGITANSCGGDSEYPSNKIPQQLIDAVLYVANESNVYTSVSGNGNVKRKKTDVLEKEFFESSVSSMAFKKISRADSLLSKFTMLTNSNFFMVI